MSLSTAGNPLAVLSNSSAFAYQPGMKTWMHVVDSAFALSSYSTILASSMAGELPTVCFSSNMPSAKAGSPAWRVKLQPHIVGCSRLGVL